MIADTGNLLLNRQLARWYELRDHDVQLKLVDAVGSGIRFPLVPAGRRSGKTERFKRFIVKWANKYPGIYFAAAPVHDQAKKIFWNDLKDFSLSCMHHKKPSETNRILHLNNGSEIHVIGLDKPQRIEGIPWSGGGIDEFADIKAEAWESNILPALNTVNPLNPDYRAFCWLLGVPDGLNHYYDLCQKADAGLDPNFQVFKWMSAEILPAEDIAMMKNIMSEKQFKQEWEASFETAGGRIYDDYSKDNHTDETIQSHEAIYWTHDQNYTPLSSAISVIRGDNVLYLDEIVLTSAVARQQAIEFVEKYKDHKNKVCNLYGDPHGRVGEKHGHASDFTEIKGVLVSEGWTINDKVKRKHPAIKDRQNAVRAKICNASGERTLFVNPKLAKWVDKGLATVQAKEGSSFQEDEKNEYHHITTAVGYQIDTMYPINKTIMQSKISFAM